MDTTLPSHFLNALEKFGLSNTRGVGTRHSRIDLHIDNFLLEAEKEGRGQRAWCDLKLARNSVSGKAGIFKESICDPPHPFPSGRGNFCANILTRNYAHASRNSAVVKPVIGGLHMLPLDLLETLGATF